MSVSYRAYTILGCKIEPEDLLGRKEVSFHRRCESGGGDKKFCPDCGGPAKETEILRFPIPGFNNSVDPEDWEINGMPVHTIRQGSKKFAFVGTASEADEWSTPFSSFNETRLETFRERVQAALEPAGLWNPENFRIWTVLGVSG